MLRWTNVVAIIFGIALTVAGIALSGEAIRAGNSAASASIQVLSPWARATPGGAKVAAAYLTLKSSGAVQERLLAVTSSRAKRVELHTHTMKDGVMRMRRVDGLTIPEGGTHVLKPGGDHIMLLDLVSPLKAGEMLPLTLTLEGAGDVMALAKVLPIGSTGPIDQDGRGSGASHTRSDDGDGAGHGHHRGSHSAE